MSTISAMVLVHIIAGYRGLGSAFEEGTQPLSRAGKTRHDGSNRNAQFLGNLAVAEVLKAHQQQDLAVLKAQGIDRSQEVPCGRAVRRRHAELGMVGIVHDVLLMAARLTAPDFV